MSLSHMRLQLCVLALHANAKKEAEEEGKKTHSTSVLQAMDAVIT